jgi:hypothetical protein
MTESPLTVCPDCSGPVKKLMSRSSFQLKGGGWYSDGYSSKAGDSSGSSATPAPAKNTPDKTEKKAGSSSETAVAKTNTESCSATT